MNRLTTPIAILISGILIALVLALKSFPRYEYVMLNKYWVIQTDKYTGYACLVGGSYDIAVDKKADELNLDICEDIRRYE